MKALCITLLASTLLLTGCHTSPRGDVAFTVADGSFEETFSAARSVLRDYRFTLDRVDAQAGVITSTPQASAGIIAPWESTQSSASEEIEDLLHQQSRRVRVEFFDNNTKGVVTVAVERTQLSNLRPSQIVGLTTQAYDPQAEARGQAGVYQVVVRRDDDLAKRIARDIEKVAVKK